jgi:hypothetical protein
MTILRLLAIAPVFLDPQTSQPRRGPDPRTLVMSARRAMRNSAADSAPGSIRLTGIDHTWILGNAERAEGPWRVAYAALSELYDTRQGRLRRSERPLRAEGPNAPERVTVVADSVAVVLVAGRYASGSRGTFEDMIDRVDALPFRALDLAASSRDLRLEKGVTRFGIAYDVVSFPCRNGRMRIELSRQSHLPAAVEIRRTYPDNFRWAPFGDVAMRTDNVDWQVTPSGWYWPMQQKISFNGQPLRDVTYASAAIDSPVPADSFTISDSARVAYTAASQLNFSRLRLGMRGPSAELAAGIVRVPDFWLQTLV